MNVPEVDGFVHWPPETYNRLCQTENDNILQYTNSLVFHIYWQVLKEKYLITATTDNNQNIITTD